MKYNNDQVLKLMSLSEEINQINLKVKQLVDDLHGAEGVLGSIKELSDRLKDKVGEFNGNVESYKPTAPPTEGNTAKASYASEGVERERIVPTPQNWRDYAPQSYATGNAATIQSDNNKPLEKPVSSKVDAPPVNDVKPESKVEKASVVEDLKKKHSSKKPAKNTKSVNNKSGKRTRKAPPKRGKKLFSNNINIDKFSGGEDEK